MLCYVWMMMWMINVNNFQIAKVQPQSVRQHLLFLILVFLFVCLFYFCFCGCIVFFFCVRLCVLCINLLFFFYFFFACLIFPSLFWNLISFAFCHSCNICFLVSVIDIGIVARKKLWCELFMVKMRLFILQFFRRESRHSQLCLLVKVRSIVLVIT